MNRGYQKTWNFQETSSKNSPIVTEQKTLENHHKIQDFPNRINLQSNPQQKKQHEGNQIPKISSICGSCLLNLRGEEIVDFGWSRPIRRYSTEKDKNKIKKNKKQIQRVYNQSRQNQQKNKILSEFLYSLHQTPSTRV